MFPNWNGGVAELDSAGGKTGLARKGRYFYEKLILAIVSNDDSGAVSSAITREGLSVYKNLPTTGGFLMAGNTTFISGVEDDKVDTVIGIIAKYSSRRTQIVPSTSTMEVACTPPSPWKSPWAVPPSLC